MGRFRVQFPDFPAHLKKNAGTNVESCAANSVCVFDCSLTGGNLDTRYTAAQKQFSTRFDRYRRRQLPNFRYVHILPGHKSVHHTAAAAAEIFWRVLHVHGSMGVFLFSRIFLRRDGPQRYRVMQTGALSLSPPAGSCSHHTFRAPHTCVKASRLPHAAQERDDEQERRCPAGAAAPAGQKKNHFYRAAVVNLEGR